MTPPYSGFSPHDLRRIEAETPVASVEYHATLASTNDRALELARDRDLVLPALVLTAQQTSGRGRGLNLWSSADGSLTFSLVMKPPETLFLERLPIVSLVSALAVCDTVAELLPAGNVIGLKWPNDVFLDGGKVCGILAETVAAPERIVVIGVGLNVNNNLNCVVSDVRHRATSLKLAADKQFPLADTLVPLLSHLVQRISSIDGANSWLDGCRRYCMLTGRMIEVGDASNRKIGLCQGIAADGKLVLESAGQVSTVASGTVREVGQFH